MKRTARLDQIVQILRDNPDGVRVVELSNQCEVDRRTIYRDLETLQEQGVPLWQTNGRYGIEREQYLASLPINLNEAFTILWALRLLMHQTDVTYPHALSVIAKLNETLPPQLSQYITTLRDTTPPKPLERFMHVVENLTRAWADSLKVKIWYMRTHKESVSRRVIAPHILDTTPAGQLYVIGYDEKIRDVRTFSVQRITRVEVLEDQPFRRLPDVDFQQYVATARDITTHSAPSETVVLRFTPEVAPIISQSRWFPGQKIDLLEDGSCLYVAEVMDWKEMEKWVRSWAEQVEVIAPTEFRIAIAVASRRTAKLYS